ncbi:MAG: hypoxanthine phosphoribosyltransferase [Ferruginibacter sp.]|nr:hypoxanthine phosphoribosyltransferase [Cytophagales bacterium]
MITVGDKDFVPFIERKTIEARIAALALQISQDYQAKRPLLVGVLNGAFMFAADLMKEISVPCEISFVKVSSYQQAASTGRVTQLIGLQEDLTGRHVVIVEDIVDTGLTMSEILTELQKQNPRSVEITTLLFKPEALRKAIRPRYVGFEIANRFVVGYGLDYNGLGRNLADLYVLAEAPGVA